MIMGECRRVGIRVVWTACDNFHPKIRGSWQAALTSPSSRRPPLREAGFALRASPPGASFLLRSYLAPQELRRETLLCGASRGVQVHRCSAALRGLIGATAQPRRNDQAWLTPARVTPGRRAGAWGRSPESARPAPRRFAGSEAPRRSALRKSSVSERSG